MARPRKGTRKTPSYRLHKASGRAVVTIAGRDFYLGAFESPESHRRYHQLLADAEAGRLPEQGTKPAISSACKLSVADVVAAFWRHAETWYRKPTGEVDARGEPVTETTSELSNIRHAFKPLLELHRALPANDFTRVHLRGVVNKMIEAGRCRSSIRRDAHRIKRLFKWAASEGIIGSTVHADLSLADAAYLGLALGRSRAKERPPVRPVGEDHAKAVIPHVAREVGAMIELQLLTGMRPGEVTAMRSSDIEMSGDVWTYTPRHHKTAHHGHARIIPLGPKAQAVVEPFLRVDEPHAFIFSPVNAERRRRDELHAMRITPAGQGNHRGSNRVRRPERRPGERYTPGSYARAIREGVAKAFPPPAEIARGKVPTGPNRTRWETVAEWHARIGAAGVKRLREHAASVHWHPHQLRHTAATYLRKVHGVEAAQVMLGHSQLSATEIYAERNTDKAIEIARKWG